MDVVYKIGSGYITNRIKTVLPCRISGDQSLLMGENTRLIYDIMNYTEQENIPGLLLLIDIEKAFDTMA